MANTPLSAEAGTAQVDEPVLNVSNIQGNIIPGFNKDFQALLFLKIEEGKKDNFRHWLEALVPRVTTMERVLVFRNFLKDEEWYGKTAEAPPKVKTTWINIAFSHAALNKKLGAIKDINFKDKAFISETGMRGRPKLGDPTDSGAEGHPENWVVGGPDNEADVILIVASDDRLDLFDEVTRIENSLYAPLKINGINLGRSGVRVIFKQYGANLPGSREHFGFRDGISQPGVRGRIPENPDIYLAGGDLTPRQYSKKDESRKLGQDLVRPGEFVFGREYLRQDPNETAEYKDRNSLDYGPQDVKKEQGRPSSPAAPEWAQDGSFLVFRRLRQDVGAFHKFLRDNAADPGLLGAKCVGRWPSGTPILHAPKKDKAKAAMAQDESINNDFMFTEDPKGEVCPFDAHIRKVYPRDDKSAQTHRLLRRGIPYGEPSWSSPTAHYFDTVDRGLLFLAYQTSIENQFEFLQEQANNPDFKGKSVGHDPIIGQNGQSRTNEWVIPTGGGYFFAPSIEALSMLANPLPEIRDDYFSSACSTEVLPKSKSLKAPPKAITPEEWARVWAHAWLDKDFKDMLKRNPATAVKEFQKQAPSLKVRDLDPHDKFFNLVGDIYEKSFDKGPFMNMSFKDMSLDELTEIAAKATLRGNPFCVQQNEWVPT